MGKGCGSAVDVDARRDGCVIDVFKGMPASSSGLAVADSDSKECEVLGLLVRCWKEEKRGKNSGGRMRKI